MLALLLAASAAAAALVEHNVTMRSTAAILHYTPFNTTVEQGWNETYSEASWGEYNTRALPDGDSAFVTSYAGATVGVSWVGTGAYFHGTGGDVAVSVDGKDVYSGGMGVVGVGGLPYAAHNATLTVRGGTVSVTNLTLTTIIGGAGAVDIDAEINALDKDTNTNKELTVVGRWGESTTFCGSMQNETWSSTNCVRWDSLGTEQNGASLAMRSPPNASIALLSGAVGSEHDAYTVVVDPAPPHSPPSVSGSAARAWMGPGNLLYYGSLDPTQRYNIRIQFVGKGVLEWGRAHFIVTQGGEMWSPVLSGVDDSRGIETPADEQNRSNTPIGAIIGAVIGGLTLLLLLGGIWWRRRRRARSSENVPKAAIGKKWRRSEFEVDVVDQTNQSGALGTYLPMHDPVRATADMLPDTAENRITPLPAPWPGDMVSQSSSGKGSSPTGSAPHGYAQSSQSALSLQPAPYAAQAPGSAYSSSQSSHVYPPQKSPFADPPGMALSPSTPTQAPYPIPPLKAALLPPRPMIVTEAEDAGRIVEEQVPPRYNPAWAENEPRR
ncbi:hypothetical protein CC85DRAFT_285549 [Cutaneotrichosporon oleaginosum]|uniref:Uncharacterized protein n=1 Tax=Cutaneotrichosporon oleaginosum TaxID=879819 RepID=A0A0J0XMY6_9TREE|nr:uncharacterized protein CC85DRAFT_285549 [Cutaneotrichosporon oleaginosum]KLT42470.1 hypothetical protein CC85DRAFT_285549 [Cutaneotrichosporon oleaginosum]TXT06989.1 hypothetical protein COLE_06320 [Cutaneotrichosporon oleaginosum]